MEKFKSKTDIWLIIFLGIALGVPFFRALYSQAWGLAIFMLIINAFVAHIFLSTFYIIENESLIIKSGFLVNIKIDIQSIKKISDSNNIMSSPALSFDRIEISFNKFDAILISPKDKSRFIEAILKINSDVEIKYKSNKI
ncbi:hypothetical protein GON26_19350 [Flavobacterium sp. GA093]|uniref:Uncharacterized protein YyaB-like PH domain-containing protein n=1 Tax=Flavobacterium hydrocarbonoxydans TaxID=2683249 RepID=A0A6I4NQ00_9FLAO|nr:PH domain-containing protein [Flavobacterium hydrocarbonoxydans]MWB96526.1 hypothetical protein [Flavobacterium hydrocarbonoxydans]